MELAKNVHLEEDDVTIMVSFDVTSLFIICIQYMSLCMEEAVRVIRKKLYRRTAHSRIVLRYTCKLQGG